MLSFAFKDSIFFIKIMSHLRVDLLFSLRKEKSKQKRNKSSEESAVIFFLYGINAYEAYAKTDSQNGNGGDGDRIGISHQRDHATYERCDSDDQKRFPERFAVGFRIGYLRLMIIVDQLGVSFVDCHADGDEEDGDREHDNGIEEHTFTSFRRL